MIHPPTPQLPIYSPTLSTPLALTIPPLAAAPHSQQAPVQFIQIFWHFASPHFSSRNDLWQLEMGSVGGASSNTLPSFTTPSPRPILLCRRALFLSSFKSHLFFLSAGAGLEKLLFTYFVVVCLLFQCVRQIGRYSSICWHVCLCCIFGVCVCAFTHRPPTVWFRLTWCICDTESNPPVELLSSDSLEETLKQNPFRRLSIIRSLLFSVITCAPHSGLEVKLSRVWGVSSQHNEKASNWGCGAHAMPPVTAKWRLWRLQRSTLTTKTPFE